MLLPLPSDGELVLGPAELERKLPSERCDIPPDENDRRDDDPPDENDRRDDDPPDENDRRDVDPPDEKDRRDVDPSDEKDRGDEDSPNENDRGEMEGVESDLGANDRVEKERVDGCEVDGCEMVGPLELCPKDSKLRIVGVRSEVILRLTDSNGPVVDAVIDPRRSSVPDDDCHLWAWVDESCLGCKRGYLEANNCLHEPSP